MGLSPNSSPDASCPSFSKLLVVQLLISGVHCGVFAQGMWWVLGVLSFGHTGLPLGVMGLGRSGVCLCCRILFDLEHQLYRGIGDGVT